LPYLDLRILLGLGKRLILAVREERRRAGKFQDDGVKGKWETSGRAGNTGRGKLGCFIFRVPKVYGRARGKRLGCVLAKRCAEPGTSTNFMLLQGALQSSVESTPGWPSGRKLGMKTA